MSIVRLRREIAELIKGEGHDLTDLITDVLNDLMEAIKEESDRHRIVAEEMSEDEDEPGEDEDSDDDEED
jgi:siroheme synthase (precorrin-2 oxidase/ferrochelatase)